MTADPLPFRPFETNEHLFESAFAFASIGMALVSPEGKWLKVNKSICDLVGRTADELEKITFQDLTHPDDLKADLTFVQEMLDGKRSSYQMEKRYIHKNGNIIWGILSVSLIRHQNGTPRFFISQIQDITKLKEAQNKLHENEKMEALFKVTVELAHKINNPLTSISLNAKALAEIGSEKNPDPKVLNNFRTNIYEAIKKVETLMEHLKSFKLPE